MKENFDDWPMKFVEKVPGIICNFKLQLKMILEIPINVIKRLIVLSHDHETERRPDFSKRLQSSSSFFSTSNDFAARMLSFATNQ